MTDKRLLVTVGIAWWCNGLILTGGWWIGTYMQYHGHSWVADPLLALIFTHTSLKIILTWIFIWLVCVIRDKRISDERQQRRLENE